MITITFDDIIYSLQKSGGASVYWKEITSRIKKRADCQVMSSNSNKFFRGLPTYSNTDIFHSSHFRFSLLGKAKNVTTAHDLIYEKGYVNNSIGAKLNMYERMLSYFTADAIICISENTRKDLLEIYPKLLNRCKIYVIYHGVNDIFTCHHNNETINKCNQPYILFVGGRSGYKNFKGALEGYYLSRIWQEGIKLICTGSKFSDQELLLLSKMGLNKLVICEEHIDSVRLSELYKSAYCLLYTSYYEGFGLPPLEAMRCGCPVIASNCSSIPEIVGDAGVLVDPSEYSEIANSICRFEDPILRSHYIKSGIQRSNEFSWEQSACEHVNVYKDVLD